MRGESLSSFLRNMNTYLYEREVIIMNELMLLCIIFIGVFAALLMAMMVGINIMLSKKVYEENAR